MASIIPRQNRDGSTSWRATIRRKGHKTQVATFDLKSEAQRWAKRVEGEMLAGRFVDTSEAQNTTLRTALERYREEVTPSKKGAYQEKNRINQLLERPICELPLTKVTSSQVAQYRDGRLQAVSPSSVQKELALLSHLFTIAVTEWGINGLDNPVKKIRKPKVKNQRDRRLQEDEEQRLLNGALHPMGAVITLAIETAMRADEIAGLGWSDIDFSRSVAVLIDTKNGESRDVPLSSRAIAALKQLPRHISGSVFGLKSGNISNRFADLCKKVEIENLHFHDLRHEATSRLFELGFGIMEVAAITGHKDLKMLKRYTHLKAEDLAKRLG